MNERIENYIHSIIPKNIPQKRKQLIHDEMESHILEQAEFYMEIGYDEKVSIDKALECMGEDETTKRSIINRFEELYHEKTIFAVIACAVMFALNYLCFPTGVWMYTIEQNNDPGISEVVQSSILIFGVLFTCVFAYLRGYRKLLIGTGVANLMICASTITAFYPQCAIFAVSENLVCIWDKLFTIKAGDFIIDLIAMYGPYVFLLFAAICCFALSANIKKYGMPKRKNKKSMIALAAIYLVLVTTTCVMYPFSQKYFHPHTAGFSLTGDSKSNMSSYLYPLFSKGMSKTEIDSVLKKENYIKGKDYDPNYYSQYAQHMKDMFNDDNFLFGDEYEIWFDPYKTGVDSNGFFYIKREENGSLIGKGHGNGLKNYKKRNCDSECRTSCKTKNCEEFFKNLKKGDSQNEIMDILAGEKRNIYAEFISWENGTEKEFYRIHHPGADRELKPDEVSYCLYFELYFQNGKLTEGVMHKVGEQETIDTTVK